MKNSLLFDLDGTLTDPGLGITNSVMYALGKYGIIENDREKLYSFIGPPLVDSFAEHYGFSPEKGLEATEFFREYFREKGIFENALYPGIPEMLEGLKEEGKELFVATSKPEEFAVRILEHFHIRSCFTLVCGASMDEAKRSRKEEVLAYALEKGAIDPRGGVMIGDRKFDILGGKAFSLTTVGVLFGYGSREELVEAGADHIAESVPALFEELKKI